MKWERENQRRTLSAGVVNENVLLCGKMLNNSPIVVQEIHQEK